MIFITDRPILTAVAYRQYQQARAALLGDSSLIADEDAMFSTQFWFGTQGCEVEMRSDQVLPLAVLDAALTSTAPTETPDSASATVPKAPYVEPSELVERALAEARVGNRNTTGFALFCALRDVGLSLAAARPWAMQYQAAVAHLGGGHLYAPQEAEASLNSAYSRPPRRMHDTEVNHWTYLLANAAHCVLAARGSRALHDRMKTVAAVVQIMRQTSRLNHVGIAARQIEQLGIPCPTAAQHLVLLCATGLFQRETKSDGVRSAEYSLDRSAILAALGRFGLLSAEAGPYTL